MMEQLKKDLNVSPVDTIENKEDVRIYRLHMLEENQIKIINKIDCLSKQIDDKCEKEVNALDKRVSQVENRNNRVDKTISKLSWLVIGETIVILGFIVKSALGI